MNKIKKYIYLISATLIAVSVIVMSGYSIKNDVAEADAFALFPKSVNNTVTANGKLQYSSKNSVKLQDVGIIKSVNVSAKDKVKKGDLLFSYYKLNKEAEKAVSQYYDIQNAISLINDSSIKDQIISEVKRNSETKEILSEYDGTVNTISYSANDVVGKDSEIMTICDETELEVQVNINETYIDKIKTGQKADVVFTALPDRKFSGTVVKIADEATQTSGLTGKETTVQVTVRLDDNIKDKVRIGYSADCTIITSTDDNVLILPYECIRSDDKGDYVFTIKKNRAKKVYVKTGKEYKDGTEIVSGLSKNDLIIENCDDIYNGRKIKMNEAKNNA